jgi:hypothetical protein
MTYLTPSLLSSLTELSLCWWCGSLDNEGVAFQNIPHELHFPRLEKLALYFETPEHVWRIARRISAPLLAHLNATSLISQEDIPDQPPEPKFP